MRERLKGTGGSMWAVHRQGSLRPKPFDERPYPLTPSSRSPPGEPPLLLPLHIYMGTCSWDSIHCLSSLLAWGAESDRQKIPPPTHPHLTLSFPVPLHTLRGRRALHRAR